MLRFLGQVSPAKNKKKTLCIIPRPVRLNKKRELYVLSKNAQQKFLFTIFRESIKLSLLI